MTSVAVMMSVYNGEKYLGEQIDSILAQRDVAVTIYIRDDGSAEPTRSMLEQYAADNPNIVVAHGENLGIKDSFLQIIRDVPLTHEYYAFSDADDVWLPEKMAAAVQLLGAQNPDIAQAYCSQITLVDAKLDFIGYGRKLQRPISFANAMVECRMSGATAVFNRTLVSIAQRLDYSDAMMHDAWMNLLAASFGEVHFDASSYILYRQHGSNADGGMRTAAQSWRARLKRSTLFARFVKQATALLSQAGSKLTAEKRAALLRFVSYRQGNLSAIRFLLDPKIRYQRVLSKVVTALSLSRLSK